MTNPGGLSIKSSTPKLPEELQDAYYDGVRHRWRSSSPESCPYPPDCFVKVRKHDDSAPAITDWSKRHAWLAGYHDANQLDVESDLDYEVDQINRDINYKF